jgi:putative thioredoxin
VTQRMLTSVVRLTSTNFEDVVLAKNGTPILVDFWAPGCGPCRRMKRVMASLVRSLVGKAVVAELNVDAEPSLADVVRIQSVPTFVLLLDGEVKDVFVGLTPEATLRRRIVQLSGQRPSRRYRAGCAVVGRPVLGARP